MTKIQTPAPTRAQELAEAWRVLQAADMAPEMRTSANTRRGAKGYTSEVTRVAWRAWQARAAKATDTAA